jgi:hypothetical protein
LGAVLGGGVKTGVGAGTVDDDNIGGFAGALATVFGSMLNALVVSAFVPVIGGSVSPGP